MIPASLNFDTVGPFGRTVSDAACGLSAIVEPHQDYCQFLSGKESLKGAKFGMPYKRCYDVLSEDIRPLASGILSRIRDAGAQVFRTDFPCAEERIPEDGGWDWYGSRLPT